MRDKSLLATALVALALSAGGSIPPLNHAANAQSAGGDVARGRPAGHGALDVDPAVSEAILERRATAVRLTGDAADVGEAVGEPAVPAAYDAATKPATAPDDKPKHEASGRDRPARPVSVAQQPPSPGLGGGAMLHRLQAPFPDHNVVVCVAGCPSGREKIVYFERRKAGREVAWTTSTRQTSPIVQIAMSDVPMTNSAAATAASAPAGEPASDAAAAPITCIAGCYSTPKAYSGRRDTPASKAGHAGGRVEEGTWLTATPAAAGDTRHGDAAMPAGSTATRTRMHRGRGSDWFTGRQ